MRISTRLLLLFIVIAFVFGAFFYLFYYIKREELRVYNESDLSQRKITIDAIMDQSGNAQLKLTEDYAISDELTDIAYYGDNGWAADNLQTINSVFGYTLLQVYNAAGEKMYSQTDEGNPGFSEYTMEKVIADTLREGGVRAFYDAFHQNTVFCTVSSIHPTGDPKRQSSPAGFILVAKVLDYPYLKELSESLKYSVQITRQRPGDEMVNEKYNTRIVKPLINNRNETAAWLIFESSNPFLQRLRSLGNLILFGTMGFIFIFLMIQFFLIQQWISSPLGLISQSLKNSDPAVINELTDNGNEFADVAQLIERFFAQQDKLIEEIKERARTEARIREIEEQTRKILLTIPEAIVVTDLDGHILSVNDEALRMLGESNLQRLISGSMKLENSVIRADRKHLRNMFQDLFKGLYVRNQEVSLLNSLGEEVPALVSASVIMDDDNKPLKLVFSSRDLSDMKELEIQLRQSQKMESIGTMAGGIAHDFNNIITIIAGYVALSAGKIEENAEAQNDLDEALKACLRAKSLISKILTFTHKGEQDVEEVVMADVIEDTLPMIRAIIPAKVSIQTEINSHSYARVDCTEMQQVMLNLATNAFHAMQPDGGTLKISLEEKAGFELIGIDPKVLLESPYLHLCVSDTGSGIAPELISRIFDPYFSTKASGEGTGLGLSIVHGIVNGYRGFITVCSNLGDGSTFNIYIPAVESTRVKAPAPKAEVFPFIPASVLIVDDELALADIFSQSLKTGGYTVQSFTDPAHALEAFTKSPESFDLIIADINMPTMDGIKLATEALNAREVPVILYTGFLDANLQHRAESIRVRYILNKPIMPDEMVKAVRKAMHEWTCAQS